MKLYERKTPLTTVTCPTTGCSPSGAPYGIPLYRVLTDRGTEHCGDLEWQGYELYSAMKDIGHMRTKTQIPKTKGTCERFHKTLLDEFYRWRFGRSSSGGTTSREAPRRWSGLTTRRGPIRSASVASSRECRRSCEACRGRQRRCWWHEVGRVSSALTLYTGGGATFQKKCMILQSTNDSTCTINHVPLAVARAIASS